jgi:hypothetical protein
MPYLYKHEEIKPKRKMSWRVVGQPQHAYPKGDLMCTSGSVCMCIGSLGGGVRLGDPDSYVGGAFEVRMVRCVPL